MLDSKLTVKPFLNKRLKSKGDKYLLYVSVTYNRKNNQIPFRNLVFDSTKNSTLHPYKFNKEFVMSEDDFKDNEEKMSLELSAIVEPIMIFLAKQGKDDLSIFPSVIIKLNKLFLKVVRHLYYNKLDQVFRENMPKMKDDDIFHYLDTTLESFMIAEKATTNTEFLCYEYIFSEAKKKEIEDLIRNTKFENKRVSYDFETHKQLLYKEIANYLTS